MYGEWLREELRRRGLAHLALARLVDPNDPEAARRALRRHLRVVRPSERTRRRYAEALGVADRAEERYDG